MLDGNWLAAALAWWQTLSLGTLLQTPGLHDLLAARDALAAYLQSQPLMGHALYMACFTGITALCLPGASVLMLVAGACMDPLLCLLLSNAASTLGAWITMVSVRLGLSHWAGSLSWMQRVEQQLAERDIPFLISIRLAPVIPFAAFNLLAGLTHIGHRRFLWTSFVGMLPGTWLYVNAGTQLGSVQSADELLQPSLFAAVAALAVVPWVLHHLIRHQTRLSH